MATPTSTAQQRDLVRQIDIPAAVVPASSTLIADSTLPTMGCGKLAVHMTVAVAALTGLTVQGRVTNADAFFDIVSAGANFTTPKYPILGASGDVTIQGVGSGWFIMDVRGFEAVRLKGTSAGTATLALAMGAT